MEIIPAIDIIDGKCVRLSQGDFSKKRIYYDDPLEVAKQFEAHGLRRVHLVDLDGAKLGKITNLSVLQRIANQTKLVIDFGGGIKSGRDLKMVFDAGAQIAAIGSIAIRHPEIFFGWLNEYGAEKLLIGADVRGQKLSIDGWQTETDKLIVPFLKECIENGVTSAFCTDIRKDGLMRGPSIDLYEEILKALPNLKLIASGGVSSFEDLNKLEEIGCSGAIVGKAIYEQKISFEELKTWL